MEVKSRKKSNLYDSIKKNNRCDDTVCGKKDELSELSKRLKLAKSTYDMLNNTLSEIDTKSPSHEDVMNATNEARKEYDTLKEMYEKKSCNITDTKLEICSLGNVRITFPSELKINDDNIRGFSYIDGNINDLEVELYDTKYGDKTPLKLFNYLKDNQDHLGNTIDITIFLLMHEYSIVLKSSKCDFGSNEALSINVSLSTFLTTLLLICNSCLKKNLYCGFHVVQGTVPIWLECYFFISTSLMLL